jgi:hypothetical protein
VAVPPSGIRSHRQEADHNAPSFAFAPALLNPLGNFPTSVPLGIDDRANTDGMEELAQVSPKEGGMNYRCRMSSTIAAFEL